MELLNRDPIAVLFLMLFVVFISMIFAGIIGIIQEVMINPDFINQVGHILGLFIGISVILVIAMIRAIMD